MVSLVAEEVAMHQVQAGREWREGIMYVTRIETVPVDVSVAIMPSIEVDE